MRLLADEVRRHRTRIGGLIVFIMIGLGASRKGLRLVIIGLAR